MTVVNDTISSRASSSKPKATRGLRRLGGVAAAPRRRDASRQTDLDASGSNCGLARSARCSPVKPMHSPSRSTHHQTEAAGAQCATMRSIEVVGLLRRHERAELAPCTTGSALIAANGAAVGVRPAAQQQPFGADLRGHVGTPAERGAHRVLGRRRGRPRRRAARRGRTSGRRAPSCRGPSARRARRRRGPAGTVVGSPYVPPTTGRCSATRSSSIRPSMRASSAAYTSPMPTASPWVSCVVGGDLQGVGERVAVVEQGPAPALALVARRRPRP